LANVAIIQHEEKRRYEEEGTCRRLFKSRRGETERTIRLAEHTEKRRRGRAEGNVTCKL